MGEAGDRRFGCEIRFVTPKVERSGAGQNYAMLVRGMDHVQGWINVASPTALLAPTEVARYDTLLAHQSAALAEGAQENVKPRGTA